MKFVSSGVSLSALLAASLLVSLGWAGTQASDPGTCIGQQESELVTLINDYRSANALPAIPISTVLTTVGQWHVRDARLNGSEIFNGSCNLHSWSTMRPDLWSGGCYTADHSNASLMWSKPAEISDGAFTATGFEIAYWGSQSMPNVLAAWQSSTGHNDVLLNQGNWESFTWQAIGVGVEAVGSNAYVYAWFATETDPSSALEPCPGAGPLIFEDQFEQ